jgi:hypothetical protein
MTAPDTPHELTLAERNAFLESLAPEAKERFLDALTRSKEAGLTDRAAWVEAVVAAETAYSAPLGGETVFDPDAYLGQNP